MVLVFLPHLTSVRLTCCFYHQCRISNYETGLPLCGIMLIPSFVKIGQLLQGFKDVTNTYRITTSKSYFVGFKKSE